MSGWVPVDAAAWPFIAAALAKPWPREAIYFDLRWWADQERMGRAKLPGRPALRERWGVRDWDARCALRAACLWKDPRSDDRCSPVSLQRSSSDPPVSLQPHNGPTPAIAENPPVSLQRSSSDPPVSLHTRAEYTQHTTHNTQHTTQTECVQPPPAEAGPSEPWPEWAMKERKTAGVTAEALTTHVLGAIESIRQKPVTATNSATDARVVLGQWRALGRPPLAEFRADLEIIARAARECPDALFARDLRAEGWAEGKDRSRSVATLCRRERWGDRLDAARQWEAAGFPTGVNPAKARASPARSGFFAELDAFAEQFKTSTILEI